MTEQEALEIAYSYAAQHELKLSDAVLTATFEPVDSPFNIWKLPYDRWLIICKFPLLEGIIHGNFFVIEINCQTKAATHRNPM